MTKTHFHHTDAGHCACDHGHENGRHHFLGLPQRWLLTVVFVGALLMLLRPFIVAQMLVRVTSYSANASYADAIRICKKIIAIDPGNRQAWTSLGYAYMDSSNPKQAISVFNHVLRLDPDDRGAASFELGLAYYGKGEYSRAIEHFEHIRSAGPRAGSLLEADILKYRHGTLGFRSLNSMQTLLEDLLDSYKHLGNKAKIIEIEKDYNAYKNRHSKILF